MALASEWTLLNAQAHPSTGWYSCPRATNCKCTSTCTESLRRSTMYTGTTNIQTHTVLCRHQKKQLSILHLVAHLRPQWTLSRTQTLAWLKTIFTSCNRRHGSPATFQPPKGASEARMCENMITKPPTCHQIEQTRTSVRYSTITDHQDQSGVYSNISNEHSIAYESQCPKPRVTPS